jgi:hypothetical protein
MIYRKFRTMERAVCITDLSRDADASRTTRPLPHNEASNGYIDYVKTWWFFPSVWVLHENAGKHILAIDWKIFHLDQCALRFGASMGNPVFSISESQKT